MITLLRLRMKQAFFSEPCQKVGRAFSYCRAYCRATVSKCVVVLPYSDWHPVKVWEVKHGR